MQSFKILVSVPLKQVRSLPPNTLTCLSDVPQAWLGSGTWEVLSLLLVSLSVVLVTALVRCLLTRPQCSPPLTLRLIPTSSHVTYRLDVLDKAENRVSVCFNQCVQPGVRGTFLLEIGLQCSRLGIEAEAKRRVE